LIIKRDVRREEKVNQVLNASKDNGYEKSYGHLKKRIVWKKDQRWGKWLF